MKAELGANWIHGIDKNPIFTIAKQHKLLDEPVKVMNVLFSQSV